MNVNIDSCVTCALLLVSFAFTLCQSQGRDCTLSASPHPEGMCGAKLAMAHSNLCFLLRRSHPTLFPNDKRSSPTSYANQEPAHDAASHSRVRRDSNVLERIYSIPMPVLARLHLTDDNWRSFVYKRDRSELVPGEKTDEFEYALPDLEELPELKDSPTRMLIRMLSKRRSPVKKRSVGLVCDCCINRCTVRLLATYC